MPIEKLHVMPTHEKVEDGYAYNPKYVGNIYQLNDNLVYFKEKSTVEYPLKLAQIIKEDTLAAVESNLQVIYEALSNLEKQTSNEELKVFVALEIAKIKNQVITKEVLTETINGIVDTKLTEVYNNFNAVTKQLVREAVSNELKDSKRDQAGKLKITTLMMLKEMGLTPDEIIKYTENGLI